MILRNACGLNWTLT